VADADPVPRIYVLAGTNGAGKSSIIGAMFLQAGAEYFNPDEAARWIQSANPGISQVEANSAAWQEGKRLLERAITDRYNFAFETTLGGNTIPRLLTEALSLGLEVRIWYVGLHTPELHIARVRSRVEKGGHDIPEAEIRMRFEAGRLNLIRLLPKLTELRMYDNSAEFDPDTGHVPRPQLILHMQRGTIVNPRDLPLTPEWAKPIVAAALKLATR
jgi:predicted ABC-type ATPase